MPFPAGPPACTEGSEGSRAQLEDDGAVPRRRDRLAAAPALPLGGAGRADRGPDEQRGIQADRGPRGRPGDRDAGGLRARRRERRRAAPVLVPRPPAGGHGGGRRHARRAGTLPRPGSRAGLGVASPVHRHRPDPAQGPDDDHRGVQLRARPGPRPGEDHDAEPAGHVRRVVTGAFPPGLLRSRSSCSPTPPTIIRAEAAELARLGCTYIQIDSPDLGTLVDPENRALREGLGMDTERTLTEGVDIINLRGRRARGNVRPAHLQGQQQEHVDRDRRLRVHRRQGVHPVRQLRRVPARVRRRALGLLRAAGQRARRQGGRARPGARASSPRSSRPTSLSPASTRRPGTSAKSGSRCPPSAGSHRCPSAGTSSARRPSSASSSWSRRRLTGSGSRADKTTASGRGATDATRKRTEPQPPAASSQPSTRPVSAVAHLPGHQRGGRTG